MNSKILFIVNPTSGNGKGEQAIKLIKRICDKININYDIKCTLHPNHATEITKGACHDYDIIVSCGGDGTLNEVVNGLVQHNNSKLCVLPVGSGNDFVKNLNYPKSLDSILLNLKTPQNQTIRKVNVGKLEFQSQESNKWDSMYFINNVGIGFDAYVGHLNQRNKKLPGLASYIYSVVVGLVNFSHIKPQLKFDDVTINSDKLMITIGNGTCSGGGFYLTPYAKIDDGKLDISIFDNISRIKLLSALPFALFNKIDMIKEVKFYRTNNSIEIKLKNPYYIHCDGEIATKKLIEARISLIDKNINFIDFW